MSSLSRLTKMSYNPPISKDPLRYETGYASLVGRVLNQRLKKLLSDMFSGKIQCPTERMKRIELTEWTREVLGSFKLLTLPSDMSDLTINQIYNFLHKYLFSPTLQSHTNTAFVNFQNNLQKALKFCDLDLVLEDAHKIKNTIIGELLKSQPQLSVNCQERCLLGIYMLTNGDPYDFYKIQNPMEHRKKMDRPSWSTYIDFSYIVELCYLESKTIVYMIESVEKIQGIALASRRTSNALILTESKNIKLNQLNKIDISMYLSLKPQDIYTGAYYLAFDIMYNDYIKYRDLMFEHFENLRVELMKLRSSCSGEYIEKQRLKRKAEDDDWIDNCLEDYNPAKRARIEKS